MTGMKDTLGDTPYVAIYPSAPGHKEPTTSRDAAARIKPSARKLRDQVMAVLRRAPSTADEVAAALGLSILAVRPRLSELRAAGQIGPTGERRKNESGMSAIVWMAVPCSAV